MIGTISEWFRQRAEQAASVRAERDHLRDAYRRLLEENRKIDVLLDGSRRDVITMSEEVKRLQEDNRKLRASRPSMRLGPEPCAACEARRIEDLNRTGEEKRNLEKQNDAQAARAMSRQTKQHFQAYQAAVKIILDRIDALGKKNAVTKEDLRKLRELRTDLSNQINREI